jgi:hypothetical protein
VGWLNANGLRITGWLVGLVGAGLLARGMAALAGNVSIATVAKDGGTIVTGIQSAITLLMASLMITDGKIGQILGRKRAFAIGCLCRRPENALDKAGGPTKTATAIVAENDAALDGLRSSLSVLATIALIALPFSRRVPIRQPASAPTT